MFFFYLVLWFISGDKSFRGIEEIAEILIPNRNPKDSLRNWIFAFSHVWICPKKSWTLITIFSSFKLQNFLPEIVHSWGEKLTGKIDLKKRKKSWIVLDFLGRHRFLPVAPEDLVTFDSLPDRLRWLWTALQPRFKNVIFYSFKYFIFYSFSAGGVGGVGGTLPMNGLGAFGLPLIAVINLLSLWD